jgi:hypothetical protein
LVRVSDRGGSRSSVASQRPSRECQLRLGCPPGKVPVFRVPNPVWLISLGGARWPRTHHERTISNVCSQGRSPLGGGRWRAPTPSRPGVTQLLAAWWSVSAAAGVPSRSRGGLRTRRDRRSSGSSGIGRRYRQPSAARLRAARVWTRLWTRAGGSIRIFGPWFTTNLSNPGSRIARSPDGFASRSARVPASGWRCSTPASSSGSKGTSWSPERPRPWRR